MSEDVAVAHRFGWRMYFSVVYWRVKIAGWLFGRKSLNVIETFEIEVPDDPVVFGAKQ